jgi:hypothetical protein
MKRFRVMFTFYKSQYSYEHFDFTVRRHICPEFSVANQDPANPIIDVQEFMRTKILKYFNGV